MSCHKLMMRPVCVNFVQVRRALPPDLLAKYEQRQAEHVVVEANIAGLVNSYCLAICCQLSAICFHSQDYSAICQHY